VVCGPADEIETLNFSLRYLRHFTKLPIRVVTDLARNKAEIEHDDVIDYRTPPELSHRQASILLKTKLHRIVPMPGLYCYLDSDVIAVRSGVEAVFQQKRTSATFATDGIRLAQFSPYVIRCGCLCTKNKLLSMRDAMLERRNRIDAKWKALQKLISVFDVCPPELRADRAFLRYVVRHYWLGWEEAKNVETPWMSYVASRGGTLPQVVGSLGYSWNESEHAGYDLYGRLIWAEDTVRSVERISGCKRDPKTGRWTDPEGEVLDTALIDTTEIDKEINFLSLKGCDHLRQAIRTRFEVDVPDPLWPHWNCGVFIFDDRDTELLDLWHRFSISTFEFPEWETRDQGTLVAAVWKLGLQGQGNLPKHFNFLADYYRPDLTFDSQRGFSFNGNEKLIQPFFVHVFHHFGDHSWPVWKWIESIHP